MNWQAISFDWNQVRAFLATVEEGSLSAAARALRQSQPTLGRQVAALEEALGVVLFERVGKSLILTEAGRDLLGHVREMAEAAGRISLTATGQSQAIEGRVRVTASDLVAARVLPPILAGLPDIAPGISVDLMASNSVQDLQRREADIAIRHVRPEQPDLIARLVREASAGFYASQAYFDRYGQPQSMADLAGSRMLGYDTVETYLHYFRDWGLPVSEANFAWVSDSGVTYLELLRQGLGIGVILREMADPDPDLHRVLPGVLPDIPVPYWLVTHRELQSSRRIRVVFDLLADGLKAGR